MPGNPLGVLAGIAGFGGGVIPPSSATSMAENRSVNVVGGSGSSASLAQLIGISQGPSANGGFTGVFTEDFWGGLVRGEGIEKYLPILAIGGVVVAAYLLLRK